MTQKPLLWVEVGAHAVRKRSECAGVVRAGAGAASNQKKHLLHLFLTTYDWSSLSFSLLASAYFFLSGSGRDGCLAPSNASAQEDLAR
jgi:hypothetical protein